MKIFSMAVGRLGTNCYIVKNEDNGKGFIVDPGDDFERISNTLSELSIDPEAVLLTHGHYDHIGAVEALKSEYKDMKVYASADEAEVLESPEKNLSAFSGEALKVSEAVFLNDNDMIDIAGAKIECLATPGHTVGGMCYYLECNKVVFCGDTIFRASVGRTDFPGGDEITLVDSIINKIFVLPDDTRLLPGHGPATDVEYEKANNPFIY